MFTIQMRVHGEWVSVGEFDSQEEAEFCCFDQMYDYRVLNADSEVVYTQDSVYMSMKEAI